MPITHLRPQLHHLEMLKLKGNSFTAVSVSGLYLRDLTANKRKGGINSTPL